MNVHEYQGKEIFRKYGVPVPEGRTAKTADEAARIARDLASPVVVVKAQIHAGGRGKGGGVKVCKSPDEAREAAGRILGMTLVTHQTGPEGKKVHTVLVEKGAKIVRELYLAITLDREAGRLSFIASTEGGMEIEEVAHRTPEKIIRVAVDPASGVSACHGRELGYRLGLSGDTLKKFVDLTQKLYRCYLENDCSLVEINPLIVTAEGDVVALDAKLNMDDNAVFRHKDWEGLRDLNEEDPRETEAKKYDLSYVALDGTIGCMVNGAGLAMATMDIIKLYGAEPANFLDVGGGATAEKVKAAFQIILSDKSVKAVLVNIFGGIMKCDVIAQGVISAAKEMGLTVPVVVRLEGTNVELGKKLLSESGLKLVSADGLADAAEKVVRLSKEAR
ncbi:MAG: ADP-forming succinate--CoA ligase subunit beta [Deltaproteobacteria bacterium]|nr:ADP-forming succinate--CoA ligase subunit beta [Deltaproteobacteria bacterium]